MSLHTRGIEHRHQRGLEFAFAAVRQRRTAAGVIVRRQREHAAEFRRAGGVGVFEYVAAAIHARTFAVPHAEHAIDLGAREQIGLLRAPDHRRAEIFVETRRELHARRREMLFARHSSKSKPPSGLPRYPLTKPAVFSPAAWSRKRCISGKRTSAWTPER
jgi:hypothetical protein